MEGDKHLLSSPIARLVTMGQGHA